MATFAQRVPKLIGYGWTAFLAYVFAGGAIAQIMMLTGAVGPYCTSDVRFQDIYPACEPCQLYKSVFGALNVTACPDALRFIVLSYGVAWPHACVVMIALLIHPLAAVLREISPWAPAIALLSITLAMLARTIFFNLISAPSVARAIHRSLLIGCLLLAVCLSVRL